MSKNAKKHRNKGSTQGFDGVRGDQTAKRLKYWGKNTVSLNWRRWDVEKIRYTQIVKTITYGENVWSTKFIAPYGMKEAIKQRKRDNRGRSSLPGDAKETLCLPEHYDFKDVVIDVEDEGDLGHKEFYVVYCLKCHSSDRGYMKYFTTQYKDFLPNNPTLKDVMDNWDKIAEEHSSSIMKYIDVAGCILPHEPTVSASPNESHYIVKPADHADSKCHKWTSTETTSILELLKSPQQSSAVLTSPSSGKRPATSLTSPTSMKKQKLLTVALDGSITAEKTVKVHNTKRPGGEGNATITVKHQKQLTFKSIKLIDPTVSLKKNTTDSMEKCAQNTCYSFVLSGCAKEVSNNTTIEFYDKHVKHLRKHHQESVGHIQIDNKGLPTPLRVSLDKNNIRELHAALVLSYRRLQSSLSNPLLYKPFVGDNVPFSVYTDGIQKFGKELNGAYARTCDKDLNIINAPVSLHSIKGGSMDSVKLSVEIISVINDIKPILHVQSAFDIFVKVDTLASLPEFLKCCIIISQDNVGKKLKLLFVNWPVCINADGCATNGAAVALLVKIIGLISPSARCSAHAAHGSMRRLAASKTMCVPEVVDYAAQIRPVLKHFKNSGKSMSILNEALKLLEMRAMKTMLWCPTRMGYLLTSSKRCTELLVPLTDVLVTCGIKKDDAMYFISPKCLTIMHVLADIEGMFMKNFLRRLDCDNSLIIDVFQESANAVISLGELKLETFNSFIDGITEDEWGNIVLSTKTPTGETHNLTLNYTHHPGRRAISKVDKIKNDAVELKNKILENLKTNIEDQSQSDTIVEFASCFDMKRKITCEERIEYLKKLHALYCVDYIHEVEAEFGIPGWEVTVTYEAKVKCSEEELVSQYKDLWPKLNKEWCAWNKNKDKKFQTKEFWKLMLEQYGVLCCELFELLVIMMSISPGTGPLERSYSLLEKICKKDRNWLGAKSIESLWLLAIYHLNDDDALFDGVRNILSNEKI